MKQLKVVTVVVSYNAYKGAFFPRCLEYLGRISLQDDQYRLDHQIIVVDSHSGDQTPLKVTQDFPEIDVIASNQNLGYAGGNNRGIEEAMRLGADYIAIVTQDVYVTSMWLLQAIKAAEEDDAVGVVQPLLLLWPDKEKINSTGNQIHFLGYGYAGDYQLALEKYTNTNSVEIPYFSGAVVLFPTKILQEVGNFDEEMWMYNEDQDLGWRIWLAGYKNIMAPKSRAYHQYEFSRSISKMYFMDRNRLLVVFQNYRLATLILILPALLANELAGILLALKGGWIKEKLFVWKYFLKPSNWFKLIKKRRLRQNNRVVPDRKIIKRFTGKILFQDVLSPVIKYIANPILGLYYAIIRLVIFW